MSGRTILGVFSVCVLVFCATASAQNSNGSIAGVVKDASGAILPGVTIEAASPVLIEKARTAVSDGQGLYRIVDLRPGTYTVTFTLAGFSTLKREGLELSAGFTATVNADLKVGELAETITVSGETPVVDLQNVRQQTTLSRTTLEALPTTGRISQLAPSSATRSGKAWADSTSAPTRFRRTADGSTTTCRSSTDCRSACRAARSSSSTS